MVGRASAPMYHQRVVVLCYHSIHPSLPFRSATPELFTDHLEWLREHCECVPFSRIPLARSRAGHGRPVVSVTFDDGYADNHEFALPLLIESGIPATFFVTSGFLQGDENAVETFRSLRRTDPASIKPLAWEQLEEIRDSNMEVGAHTHTHRNLARLAGPALAHEVAHSKRVIEERLGQPVTMMAYPFGRPRVHVTDSVVEAARRAGYELGASIGGRGVVRADHPLSLPRIFVASDTVDTLTEKVLGVWDPIGIAREKVPLALTRIVSPADFKV